jgi:hypothetical protein
MPEAKKAPVRPSFFDVIKASVKGNPKPKRSNKKAKK